MATRFQLAGSRFAIALALGALTCPLARAQLLGTSLSDSNVGYIDRAIVSNMVRFRYDAAYGNEVPDRAEFFYGKCGCFRVLGADPDAPGPPRLESNVDYQEIRADIELLLTSRLSGMLEVPVRFLNPEQNDNTDGLGDLQASLKYALVANADEHLTFQLRTYIPTGDPDRGLGTDHVSIEPGLLYYTGLSERLAMEAEFRYWIPIEGSSSAGTGFNDSRFAGSILRYGAGLGYDVVSTETTRITPVAELVVWTILDGMSSTSTDGTLNTIRLEETDGETIVNLKLGARVADGRLGSVYAGYGFAMTGDEWYDDIVRIEYRGSW